MNTRQVDPAILCRLLEHERCGELIHEIGLYLDETMAAGIAAQNQLFNSLSDLLNGHADAHPEDKQAAAPAMQTVLAMRKPLYTERDKIHSDLDQILVDTKKDGPSNARQAVMMTQGTMRNMMSLMKKDSQGFDLQISPEEVVESILGLMDMAVCSESESVRLKMDQLAPRLREDLTEFFTLAKAAKEQDG